MMSLGFITLFNSGHVSINFMISTIGVAEPILFAILLVSAWPLHAIMLIVARLRQGSRTPISWMLVVRALKADFKQAPPSYLPYRPPISLSSPSRSFTVRVRSSSPPSSICANHRRALHQS